MYVCTCQVSYASGDNDRALSCTGEVYIEIDFVGPITPLSHNGNHFILTVTVNCSTFKVCTKSG